MDRFLSVTLFGLALACGCVAAVLTLSGFVAYAGEGRWPDQSLLRVAYDSRLISPGFFLANDWSMPLRGALKAVPAALFALGLMPVCWWLSNRLAGR